MTEKRLEERNVAEVADEGGVAREDQLLGVVAAEASRVHLFLEEAARSVVIGLQRGAEVEADAVAAALECFGPGQTNDFGVVGEEPEGHGEDPVDLLPAVGRVGDGVVDALEPVDDVALEHLAVQRLFGREMVQEAGATNADPLRDVVQRGAVVPSLGEEVQGLVEDRLSRRSRSGHRHGRQGYLSNGNTRGVSTTLTASVVVTPTGILERGRVVVEDGRIVDVGPVSGADSVPDRVLAPGFVDLQVNGHDDVNCATAADDDWRRMDGLLLAQGVTAWCPTLVTAPLENFASPLERIGAAMARPAAGRPEILGAHLEGPFLGGAPGAHRREHLAPIDLEWLAWLPPVVRVVTLGPELDLAVDAVRLLADKGILVSLGHSTADARQVGDAVDAGARLVTHLFNGMGPLHHRNPGLLGVALADDRLTPSLIADGVHVGIEALRLAARAKGRGRWILVTDAVAWRGEVRTSMVDGAPRLADGTIAGSALTMDAAIRRMVHEAAIPLADAVAAASTTPADLLRRHDLGRLAPGARADIVVLTPDLAVDEVLLAGD